MRHRDKSKGLKVAERIFLIVILAFGCLLAIGLLTQNDELITIVACGEPIVVGTFVLINFSINIAKGEELQ